MNEYEVQMILWRICEEVLGVTYIGNCKVFQSTALSLLTFRCKFSTPTYGLKEYIIEKTYKVMGEYLQKRIYSEENNHYKLELFEVSITEEGIISLLINKKIVVYESYLDMLTNDLKRLLLLNSVDELSSIFKDLYEDRQTWILGLSKFEVLWKVIKDFSISDPRCVYKTVVEAFNRYYLWNASNPRVILSTLILCECIDINYIYLQLYYGSIYKLLLEKGKGVRLEDTICDIVETPVGFMDLWNSL